jgi:3'(2'), 5'-bisphosphate nucleotidase
MTDTELLELAASLASKAAAAILRVRDGGFTVQRKDDASPVTAADHAAEAVICAGLRAAAPGIPVIAEEEVAAGLRHAPGDRFWLVDPLDGTREFAAGTDAYAVCIALVSGGVPVLGAIAVPAEGAVYAGLLGAGAWVQYPGGQRRPIRTRALPAEGATVMASSHHPDDARLRGFLAGRDVARVINLGSAVKFCRVASGEADLYPRFQSIMEWDIAAGHALVVAAGGAMQTMAGGAMAPSAGGALLYGRDGFRAQPFLCSGAA